MPSSSTIPYSIVDTPKKIPKFSKCLPSGLHQPHQSVTGAEFHFQKVSPMQFSPIAIQPENDYTVLHSVGSGAFGVVYKAIIKSTQEIVAIKKVAQDSRFKNRELEIMQLIQRYPNDYIIELKQSFFTNAMSEVFLNLVLEFMPETLLSTMKQYDRIGQTMPNNLIQKYLKNAFAALSHLSSLSICHRDVKPPNLLVDPVRQVLKLADFGSAKIVRDDEANISYICSRYYRAPELVFGATLYSCEIDVWSMGCVLAECLLGSPLFPGRNQVGLLVEIIKVLGAPSKEEVFNMNPNHDEMELLNIKQTTLRSIVLARFGNATRESLSPELKADFDFRVMAAELLQKILVYSPSKRLNAAGALEDKFFRFRTSGCK